MICIQFSQETSKVVWYSHCFNNFLVYCDTHSQRLSCSQWSRNRCFPGIPLLSLWCNNVGNLISSSSAFSKPSLYIWKFSVHIMLKPRLKDFEHNLTSKMSTVVRYLKHSLALPFFEIGMKTDLFQSCGHHWVFQICWHTECSMQY